MMKSKNFVRGIALVFVLVALSACAHKGAPDQASIEGKGKDFTAISRSKAVDVVVEPYVGVKAVPIRVDEQSQAALNSHVTLRKRGTLGSIAAAIADLTPLTVQVGADPTPIASGKGATQGPVQGGIDLPDRLDVPDTGTGRILSISYEGPLKGLLDHVAIASGYGWDYDAKTNSIIFSRLMVRTFTILGIPGKKEFKDQITNKSRETTRASIGGSGVNQTVATSDTTSQTAQSNSTDYSYDIWADTEKAVKALLSSEGSAVGNQAAGTITVRDRTENVRQVSSYIADINKRLSRQVALTVHVWALEVTDENEAGLNLQVLFANDDISIVAGGLTALGSPSSASATIISGKLKNSTGVLKALKEWGNATQVTSGGGLLLSNQPVPIQAIIAERQAAMMFNRVIPDFVDIRPTLKHEYVCPYCQQNIKTWEIDSDGALQNLPSGPLVTDGDTVFGIYEALKIAESDPCYYSLETACSCPHCGEQGFFVSMSNMSRKYDLRDYGVEVRLLSNMNHGGEELFKVHLDQYFLSFSKSPLKLWRHYASPNDGCWHIVEYKSPDLSPMVVHRFGPFRCDIGSICGPSGVCACRAGHSWEWELAAGIITELWPTLWAIAEERQWVWENSSNSNETIFL